MYSPSTKKRHSTATNRLQLHFNCGSYGCHFLRRTLLRRGTRTFAECDASTRLTALRQTVCAMLPRHCRTHSAVRAYLVHHLNPCKMQARPCAHSPTTGQTATHPIAAEKPTAASMVDFWNSSPARRSTCARTSRTSYGQIGITRSQLPIDRDFPLVSQ